MKKKILWFVIILLWIIGLIVAFFLGRNKTKIKNDEKQQVEELKGTSIYDTYAVNGLTFEEVEINKEISYIQIKGLKDQTVEDKINTNLKDTYLELFKEAGEDPNFSFAMTVIGNFNNILSIEALGYKTVNERDVFFVRDLNIDLRKGTEISFEDLFTSKDIINSILTKSLTRAISEKNALYSEDDASSDTKTLPDNSQIEDEIFRLLVNLDYKDVSFNIYNYGISFSINDYYGDIFISDYGQFLSYPKKYLTNESIFVKDNSLNKVNYNVSSSDLLYFNRQYYNDNTFVDSALFNNGETINSDLNNIYHVDSVLKKVYEEEEKSNVFNYFILEGYYVKDSSFGTYGLTYNLKNCTMTKDYFTNNVYEKIFTTRNFNEAVYRSDINDFAFTEDDKNVTCKSINVSSFNVIYDKNNRPLQTLDDIFQSDYDYEFVIKQTIAQDTHQEVAEIDLSNVKYTLEVSQIRFNYKDEEYIVYFDEFDQNALKI